MTALAGYRTRIRLLLGDPSSDRYSDNTVDEAIRQAMNQYTRARPQIKTTTHTVTAAGRDQSLSAVTDLIDIIQVIYPYDSADDTHQIHSAYYFTFGASPTLHISGASVPQVDEVIHITYSAPHTITDLDAAVATTIHAIHEATLIVGAAGHAHIMRSTELVEKYGARAAETSRLEDLGNKYLRIFDMQLRVIQFEANALPGAVPQTGWSLDQWDIPGEIHS